MASSSVSAAEMHWDVPEGARIEAIVRGVKGAESDPVAMACKGFTLTPDQLLILFKHARIVNAYELHYEFDQAPCYIAGKLSWGRESATWQVDALLVAKIHLQDGREIVLGCDEKCEALVYPEGASDKYGSSAVPPAHPKHSP